MKKNTVMNTVRPGLMKIEESVVTVYRKIEDGTVTVYKKIEDGVVGGYKIIENGAVEGFTRFNDKMIEKLFAKEGEAVGDAKKRLTGEAENLRQK